MIYLYNGSDADLNKYVVFASHGMKIQCTPMPIHQTTSQLHEVKCRALT